MVCGCFFPCLCQKCIFQSFVTLNGCRLVWRSPMSGYGHRGSQLYFHIARYMLKRTYTWRCENTTASSCGYGGWNESEDTIELEGPGETVAGGGDSATSVGLISSSRLDFDAKKDDIFLCILTQNHHQCKQIIQN